jgi:hypothetical protein
MNTTNEQNSIATIPYSMVFDALKFIKNNYKFLFYSDTIDVDSFGRKIESDTEGSIECNHDIIDAMICMGILHSSGISGKYNVDTRQVMNHKDLLGISRA